MTTECHDIGKDAFTPDPAVMGNVNVSHQETIAPDDSLPGFLPYHDVSSQTLV